MLRSTTDIASRILSRALFSNCLPPLSPMYCLMFFGSVLGIRTERF
jgi:hypothetical protein